ncbi:MAG: redoxin domain-containing protein [Dehalococcoidia bacterium]
MTGARTLPLPPMEGPIIAGFALPRADDGATLLIRSFRGRKALALYFLHDATCAGCRALLAGVLPRYGDYAFAGAEPVAIVPGSISAVAGLRRDLALPFPTLVDEAGRGAALRRGGRGGAADR